MLMPFVHLRILAAIVGAALLALFFGQTSKGAETGAERPSPAVKPYFFHNGAAWSPLVWGAPDGGMFHQRQFASPTVHRFWFGAPYLQTMISPPAASHLARTMKLKENQFYFRYHVPPGYERWGWTHGVGYAPKEPGLSYGPNVYPEKQAVIVGTPYQTQYSGEATGSYQKLLHFERRPASSNRDVEAAERYIALGDEQFAKGEFNHALRRYRQASEAAHDFAAAHFRQGFAYVASNRSDFAARAFRKGLGLEPTWNETRFDLAALCGDSATKFDEHAATLRTRAEARTADSDAYFTLGVLHFLKNDDQSAKAYFDAVYHIGGKNAAFLNGFPAGTRGRSEPEQAGG
jgi:hypothetical protein